QRNHPPEAYAHRAGAVPNPSFFSVASLQRHINNPLLHPNWLDLVARGQKVPLEPAYFFKVVQQKQLFFMDKSVIDQHLRDGASVVLEGLDMLDPAINVFAAGLDAGLPCSLVNAVAFFSQRGNEAYRGHLDSDDVLVIHVAGEKRWRLFARQSPRRTNMHDLPPSQMGKQIADIVLRPGDALYVRSCVPHVCDTQGSHSLHLSFDLADRTPPIDQMLLAGVERYLQDCADSYTPAPEVLDRFGALVLSPAFKSDMAKRTEQRHAEAAAFRARIGNTSAVSALDRLIAPPPS
ncbi:MAG: cupin domain-containing protein, partial [Sulfuricaulis sp.]|nr:cupin domain-containing protein [Sulfuricaulis sp.]